MTGAEDILDSDEEDACVQQASREWLGMGKKWPKGEVPKELELLRKAKLAIPKDVASYLFLESYETVNGLLRSTLPEPSHDIAFAKPKLWFSPLPPNADIIPILNSRRLPTQLSLRGLHDALGQALLDGAHSVVDPKYPDTRLPIYAIACWEDFYTLRGIKDTLATADSWLKSNKAPTASLETVEKAHRQFLAMQWNTHLDLPGAPSQATYLFLVQLLGDGKITTGMVDSMTDYLSDRLQSQPELDREVAITSLEFLHELGKISDKQTKIPKLLQRLEARVEHGINRILFPIYMDKQRHFLAGQIDFQKKEISYGDSLKQTGMPPPKEKLQLVQRWLKKRYPKEVFKVVHDGLEHGAQDDFHVCGFLAINTIAVDVFGDPIWNASRKVYDRVTWYLRLCQYAEELKRPEVSQATRDEALNTNHSPSLLASIPLQPLSATLQTEQASLSPRHESKPSVELPAKTKMDVALSEKSTAMEVDSPPNTSAAKIQDIAVDEPSRDMVVDEPSRKRRLEDDGRSDDDGDFQTGTYRAKSSSDFDLVDTTYPNDTDSDATTSRAASQISSSSESSFDSDASTPTQHTLLKSFSKHLLGTSKSAAWARRARANKGRESDAKMRKFRAELVEMCRDAGIIAAEAIDNMHVRCVACGREYTMKTPYATYAYKIHLVECPATPIDPKKPKKLAAKKSAGTSSLFSMGFVKLGSSSSKSSSSSSKPSRPTTKAVPLKTLEIPCDGIGHVDNPLVASYLDRTGTQGGGASSVTKLAKRMYRKAYRKLSTERQDGIKRLQKLEWKWRNDHATGRVYAVNCQKTVKVSIPQDCQADPRAQCDECRHVLGLKAFKVAIRVPRPSASNYRYIPYAHRGSATIAAAYSRCVGIQGIVETEDAEKTPCVRFAEAVLAGKFGHNTSDEALLSFVEAAMVKRERQDQGKGNQGFRYAPNIVEFAHIVASHSPAAYRFLQSVLPLPDERTLQRHRAKASKFPVGITERTFTLAAERLNAMNYRGPVGLSCDDTKLLPSLRPYWDEDRDAYVILGSTGEPVQIADPSQFESTVEKLKLEKATKLRLFVLQVPMPKMMPIVLAALGITNLDANALFVFLKQIVDGLLRHDIRVCSYACDGTSVERSVQRLLNASASRVVEHTIPHPGKPHKPITVRIHYHGTNRDCPIANMQDSKHGKKTGRNNDYSGARVLTFPNHVALYGHARQMVDEGGPLFRRDVEKVDRQDDRAASRLFSGQALEWLVDHHPEHLGTIAYLFVIGELIDAYQSRKISIAERLKMVLRTHFFMEMWESFLDKAGYSKHRHFVSPEFADIIRILIDGFLETMFIYRDDLGGRYPLLLWLLSSEPDEHSFGILRKIIPDFHMLNFHQSVPKLFIFLRQAIFSGKYSDPKATASGYNNEYFDFRDLDVSALSDFPTDELIRHLATVAYGEAENLFALLGVNAAVLNSTELTTTLPDVRSWFSDGNPARTESTGSNHHHDTDSVLSAELETDDGDTDSDDTPVIDVQGALSELNQIDFYGLSSFRQGKIRELQHAALSLVMDSDMEVQGLPEFNNNAIEEAYSDDAETIAQTLASCLRAPSYDAQPSNPFTIPSVSATGVDLRPLVELRFQHQTRCAATGTRTVQEVKADVMPNTPPPARPLTKREVVYKSILDGIKSQLDIEGKGISTGLARSHRWLERVAAPGGRDGEIDGQSATPLMNGNSANASAAATAEAKRQLTRRIKIIKECHLPVELCDARVSAVAQLQCNSNVGSGYGFVYYGGKVQVAQVITLYSKTGGKGVAHAYATDTSNIAAISYMVAQVYEPMYQRQFRAIAQKVQHLECRNFAHLASYEFLCTLDSAPRVIGALGNLFISEQDYTRYLCLTSSQNLQSLAVAFKRLKGRKKDDLEE